MSIFDSSRKVSRSAADFISPCTRKLQVTECSNGFLVSAVGASDSSAMRIEPDIESVVSTIIREFQGCQSDAVALPVEQ
jgi:hypothetical protein